MATTVAATAAALVTASLAAPAANAAGQHWGTIYVVDRGDKVGAAYGDFANNGGVYATVGANWVDMRNDGNPIYVEVWFSFWEEDTDGKWRWVNDKAVQSTRSSRFKPVGAPLSTRLHSAATQARAEIKVCEDINLTTDICSAHAILSFSY
ncbi:hypothetical protein ACFFS4_27470 [Kutzneria kofuensis]|uniref:Uncharacterized protein n=1 Tax=Kutzneria kofuensis TaxID=103725 RepID=A0A7W9NM65_9PSEU|nr:hypothetical protein [Kutzneria kofuensis]MBB5897815.1 hypothetical protein [Kutzneria kofuensis]